MYKFFLLLLIPLSLFIGQPAKANTDFNVKKEQIEQQRADLENQIKDMEKEIITLPDEEKEKVINKNIKLKMEDMKLAAYEEAYEKVIETIQQPDQYDAAARYSFSLATFSPGEMVPGDYLPIYKAAEKTYGVDFEVLAAIHKVETDFSRHPTMISSASAVGHMQFMPATFRAYGVDGNGDGVKSPWQLEDAVFSAANYLARNNYSKDVRKAIWHYNHSETYIDKVLGTANTIKGVFN